MRNIEVILNWKFLFKIKLPVSYIHQYKPNFHSVQRVNLKKYINEVKNV